MINVWVYISFWVSSHINPSDKCICWFSSTGPLSRVPLLPGAPGWMTAPSHVCSLVLPCGRNHRAHAFQTQTQFQKCLLSKRQRVWNEDSQTDAGGVVFRPVDTDQGHAQTSDFLNHLGQSTELKLWG